MKVRNLFILICVVSIVVSCREARTYDDIKYLEGEINQRINYLKNLDTTRSLYSEGVGIDNEADKLILLSRDIENIQASVNLSNEFFTTLSERHGINRDEFEEISTGMHNDELAVRIRKNELNVLNQIILKHDTSGKLLFTAQ